MSLLAACGGDDGLRTNPKPSGSTVVLSGDSTTTIGMVDQPTDFQAEDLAGDAQLRETRLIYFEFDSTQIQEEYREVLAAHARYLRDNPQVIARLEGHADERGSREYNLGLGQNRAEAVRQFIMLTGVASNQLDAISYGEEKPVRYGFGESSWSENRRVEIMY